MARCKRTTHKNNIVILCEGSDTEVKYFCDLKSYVEELHPDSFSDIKILPAADEIIREKKGSRRKKTLRQPIPSLHSDKHYWCKWEHTDEEYELYKAQPTRYVRETQLYMEEDGYVEGWAVFDKDTFTDHQTAFKLAEEIEGLHIAFSSHCFEEWLLLHFERNPHLFSASVCKNDDKDRGCGTNVPGDCHGTVCLGGYIREKRYIPDYAKSQESIFTTYTLPHIPLCYLNAAWTRTLSDNPPYECNPYTNIDMLVKRLSGDTRIFHWYHTNENIALCGTTIRVSIANRTVTIENTGNRALILKADTCMLCNEYAEVTRRLSLDILEPKSNKEIQLAENEYFLHLRTGNDWSYILTTPSHSSATAG